MHPSRRRQLAVVYLPLLFALALLLASCHPAQRAPATAPGPPVTSPPTFTAAPSAAFSPTTATTPTVPTTRPVPTATPNNLPRLPIDTRRLPTGTPARPTAAATSRTSEGVAVIGAPAWHAAGITGKGVTVAVLDESFNAYREILGDTRVTTKAFRGDGRIETPDDRDNVHGTACAEIIHETAPDAALLLVTANSAATFVEAVQWLIASGQVAVISTSYGWSSGYTTDGLSPQAQVVNRAKAAGIVFVALAGNGASGTFGSDSSEGHYGATFTDRDHDGFHDFNEETTGPAANGIKTHLTSEEMEIALSWNGGDPLASAYTFSLIPEDGGEPLRAGTRTTSVNRHTYAYLTGNYPAGTYLLKIRKLLADTPDLPLRLYFIGAQLERVTVADSLWLPGDAEGAITVGAVDWRSDTLRPSSSHGPTADGRTKPDLVAPTCVTSAANIRVGGRAFCGTSAATPHVAGAVALYRQAFPDASPEAVLAYFRANAKKLPGPDGAPNTSGAGRLALGPPPTITAREQERA